MHDDILITGFGPFREAERNPSEAIVRLLAGMGYRTLILPVDLDEVDTIISREIPGNWQFVVCTGVNPKIEWVNVERIAVNIDDFRIPDNSGRVVHEKRIIEDACDGIMTSISVRNLVDHLKSRGFDARISNSAGTYLCNHVYFLCLHRMHGRALFIHVPPEEYLPPERGASLIEAVVDYVRHEI